MVRDPWKLRRWGHVHQEPMPLCPPRPSSETLDSTSSCPDGPNAPLGSLLVKPEGAAVCTLPDQGLSQGQLSMSTGLCQAPHGEGKSQGRREPVGIWAAGQRSPLYSWLGLQMSGASACAPVSNSPPADDGTKSLSSFKHNC